MPNKVLIIGAGGREHAIGTALSLSPQTETLFFAPGNAGTEDIGTSVQLDLKQHAQVVEFIEQNNISLTVIGPEAPLVDGLADSIRKKNHLVVGVGKKAAQLEGSKIFAKEFMAKYKIPTADFREFKEAQAAREFAKSPEGQDYKVLKADGLAAGKGVFVCESEEEVLNAIDVVMEEKKFGEAGSRIILEKKLFGPEVSVMALCDGKTILPFMASQDHKRVFEGDRGPNTGGMGAYLPTPFYDEEAQKKVKNSVMNNFIHGLQSEKIDFRGIIYFGLLMTSEGPQVLEFNVRLGDPETQIILPMVNSDLFDAFQGVAQGKLDSIQFSHKEGAACTVVMTSGGYPGKFAKDIPIRGIEEAKKMKDVFVFHAGTKKSGDLVVTSGGRVLNVTAIGKNLEEALLKAYAAVNKIHFQNAFFRCDIGWRAIHNTDIYKKIRSMRENNGKELINA